MVFVGEVVSKDGDYVQNTNILCSQRINKNIVTNSQGIIAFFKLKDYTFKNYTLKVKEEWVGRAKKR